MIVHESDGTVLVHSLCASDGLTLSHGDLLVMDGLAQDELVHQTALSWSVNGFTSRSHKFKQHTKGCPSSAVLCSLPFCLSPRVFFFFKKKKSDEYESEEWLSLEALLEGSGRKNSHVRSTRFALFGGGTIFVTADAWARGLCPSAPSVQAKHTLDKKGLGTSGVDPTHEGKITAALVPIVAVWAVAVSPGIKNAAPIKEDETARWRLEGRKRKALLSPFTLVTL